MRICHQNSCACATCAACLQQYRQLDLICSNKIGGEGTVPSAAIGHARRMLVLDRDQQHRELIKCVQNHSPKVIFGLTHPTHSPPPSSTHRCIAVPTQTPLLVSTQEDPRGWQLMLCQSFKFYFCTGLDLRELVLA